MKHGFIKVATASPKVEVANCEYNGNEIIKLIRQMEKEEVKLVIFPELCITAYTCSDLFLQDTLLHSAKETLFRIIEETRDCDILSVVGLPILKKQKLYNAAAVIKSGTLLGIVPKGCIPNYNEFYEARHFNEGNQIAEWITIKNPLTGKELSIPFGENILFQCTSIEQFIFALEICEDLWTPIPPSAHHALAGATIIGNLSASNENIAKEGYRRDLVKGQSGRLICAYLYASAGEGESSTDLVFSAHNIIAENGVILSESRRFFNECTIAEIDLQKLVNERRRMTTYRSETEEKPYITVSFSCKTTETKLTRTFSRRPFVPEKQSEREQRCEEILTIQALGLKKRLEYTHCNNCVIGISGGLDSTLALLVTVKAFDFLKLDRKQITAVTMPCFGTTDRTYQNALILTKRLGVTLREIPINRAVTIHFNDIEHDEKNHNVTYENAQARERTQVLMDIANQVNGLVIGTGDMSELALGWATYNGDHMSMYGVNVSVPKTLVRYLVLYYAGTSDNQELKHTLMDILDTPVSPELLPPKEGVISQKTEDIVGPYELHDFFLYYVVRFGFQPSKIYRIAVLAFAGEYEEKVIYQWLMVFYRRFFSQQFKRSCLPDGPKVGSVSLSPRGDWRMPSDASDAMWKQELEQLNL